MHDKLLALFANRYPAIKSQFPGLGRRQCQLKAIGELWDGLSKDPKAINALKTIQPSIDPDGLMPDSDPFDALLDGSEQGLLLRTDFSDDEAWNTFCQKVAAAEQELAEALKQDDTPPDKAEASNSNDMEVDDTADRESESSDEEPEGTPGPMIRIFNPPPPAKHQFENISNITTLHLLNNVDIRPAPGPPSGEKRYQPQNRLVDQGGWQEVYTGKTIWIYDAKSNTDQCVRLVSQEGDIYGTATGDSWRVQGSHICELQFNMSFLGMKINFGGLDRWDFNERKRNLDEPM